ncbi:hypothetical protein Cgig2_007260 [Carnegiea gigantea]|uniref:Gnk2-homologous domain-containing protein n=1 Tax=Carnegiea gigantea TaxID=171969 RepID=A0A9Q1KY12_9CARY|nr:hypothetical protein Cgig2_007260 [Carnegiea gigantea]
MGWAGATRLVEPRIHGSKLVEQHPLFYVANLVLFFVIACSKEYVRPWGYYCNPDSSIPPDSPISANIDNLLAVMIHASKMNNGFSGLSSGAGNNTVYGLAQCRGDLDIKQYCYPCIQDAIQQIQKDCPGKSDAQIWCDYCTVRYSQDNFFGTFDASQNALVRNQDDYKDPKTLFAKLGPLFEGIISKAADPANSGLAIAQVDLTDGDTLYGGAQCTMDLRPFDCARCLGAAVKKFDDFCKPKQGCRVYLSSCFVRYEIYDFSSSLDARFKKIPGQTIEKLIKYEFGQAKQVNKLRSRKYMMISSF